MLLTCTLTVPRGSPSALGCQTAPPSPVLTRLCGGHLLTQPEFFHLSHSGRAGSCIISTARAAQRAPSTEANPGWSEGLGGPGVCSVPGTGAPEPQARQAEGRRAVSGSAPPRLRCALRREPQRAPAST